ncbi:MAG: glycosyltransferase [Phormidium sp.]
MVFFQIVFLILISGSIAFYITCSLCTLQFFAPREQLIKPSEEGVSLLIPVCGIDEGAYENWSSFCQQNYPKYEVLFGVLDPNDPAVPLLKELEEKYPDRVKLLIGLKPRGINYKDSNLSYLLEAAQHEIIIFADSDIRVIPDYISIVTAPLQDPKVGIVTCGYVGKNPRTIVAALASFGRCFDFIPSALISAVIDDGFRLAVGPTMVTRKSTLSEFGGLHLNRIGSDYNLAKRAVEAGYRIEFSQHILESDTTGESFWSFFQREVRWARTIRFNRGSQYYGMVFCYGVVHSILLLFISGWQSWAIALCLATFLIRYIQVLIAIFSMNCPKLLLWLWLLPFRDILSVIVWTIGAFGQQIYWRGRWLTIEKDGLITQGD